MLRAEKIVFNFEEQQDGYPKPMAGLESRHICVCILIHYYKHYFILHIYVILCKLCKLSSYTYVFRNAYISTFIYTSIKVKDSTDLKESKIEEGYRSRFLREKRDRVNNIITV